MSDPSEKEAAIPPAVEAALPAYMEMLRRTADEGASPQEVERRAELLAAEHGLDPIASGLAVIAATMELAHELGGPKAAEKMRTHMLKKLRKLQAQKERASE